MSEELIPCPFCGGTVSTHSSDLSKWAQCSECETESAAFDTEEEVRAAWNRRSAPVPAAEGGELPPMPTLPRYLLDTIGEYGMARTDSVWQLEVQRHWKMIGGIKRYASDYAHSAIAASRAQQPAQGEAQSAVEVKVERGRVWIVKGVQSFMLAHENDDEEELQWYADRVREVISNITPCVKSDISTAGAARVLDIDQQDSAQVGALAQKGGGQ